MSEFKDVAHKTVAELFDMLKEKVAEIDSLKAQLNSMEQRYIQIKKINDEQSAIIQCHFAARQELQKRVGVLSKRLNEAVSLVADDLEEAMRGAND